MSKKMKTLIIVIASVVAVALVVGIVLLVQARLHNPKYMQEFPQMESLSENPQESGTQPGNQLVDPHQLLQPAGETQSLVADDQLVALTDTEEEAQKIANMYQITLVSYSYGVATFHTEENYLDVIQRGKDNGYPELSPNYINTIQ